MMRVRRLYVLFFVIALGMTTGTSVLAQRLAVKTNEFAMNFKNGSLSQTGRLPEIKWLNPQMEFTNSNLNRIEIKIGIMTYMPLKEIKLVVESGSDSPTISTKTFATKKDQFTYDIVANVTLPDGTNTLSIECVTEQGVVVSERRKILVGKDAVENMVRLNRKDYVLLFATNKYDHWDDLVNPIHDAQAIAKELKEKYGFEVELVEDPTVETIWEKLREYNERKFTPQDQLLIFFAGHGLYDESFGEGYVVAKNSLQNDLSRTTYLSHNRLRGVINNISCDHILLTMDVCFGGTFDPVIARARGKENEVSSIQMLARKWSHKTRKYLTSGGKEYVSDGVADKHSPFAGKLIESLRSFGGDDRILTLSELQSNLEKMKQLPRFGSFGSDEPLSDFIFVGKR